mmetsp:Transcript_47359/g.152064  ORF Transcript_47359/g.152064 Transcript_47359/m.152064 type:complete len:164 (-) Transcript_47359:466-957(-)
MYNGPGALQHLPTCMHNETPPQAAAHLSSSVWSAAPTELSACEGGCSRGESNHLRAALCENGCQGGGPYREVILTGKPSTPELYVQWPWGASASANLYAQKKRRHKLRPTCIVRCGELQQPSFQLVQVAAHGENPTTSTVNTGPKISPFAVSRRAHAERATSP